ncbi:MAG: thiamine pyrophosphate-requiring protein, partial [Pseudomonadota bacterium]|nr:thiamine pyrophosphate-requiring protein [Pseudomonadota bacterium]
VNSGTDFPPIIEGLAEAAEKKIDLPTPIVVPHEMVAVGLAHGHYLGSGKTQCVMLHTNVGLSNGATGIINAACDRVPLIVMSGRTPTTERDRFGSRTVPIGWGQEMLDQTALVRECSKWDYELRFAEQLQEVIDRGFAIANSTPKGPVYLSLPREVLCEAIDANKLEAPSTMMPSRVAPDESALAEATRLLKRAKNPLIVAQNGVGTEEAFKAFGKFVDEWGIPVSQYWPIKMALPIDHPMCLGTDVTTRVSEADVILVIDALAPWWPDRTRPKEGAKVIHLGPDPLFTRTPIRNFQCDIGIVGETSDAIRALIKRMGRPTKQKSAQIEKRYATISAETRAHLEQVRTAANAAERAIPSTKAFVAQRLTKALAGEDHAVFSELGVSLGPFEGAQASSWFQEPPSGGLGWSFASALGYKLARPEKTVVGTLGDGSYMFANPTVCHQIAEALELPIVLIVLNNQEWGAVRQSVNGMYPDGYASKANEMPLTALKPSPEFTLTARASRAHTIKVESSTDVDRALNEAIELSKTAKNMILVEIAIS